MILIANELTITDETELADIEEPTFTGYAISTAITWSAPYEEAGGELVVAGGAKTFIATGGTPDDTIYGYAIVDSTGMTLQYAETYENPVAITEVGDGITVDPKFAYGA